MVRIDKRQGLKLNCVRFSNTFITTVSKIEIMDYVRRDKMNSIKQIASVASFVGVIGFFCTISSASASDVSKQIKLDSNLVMQVSAFPQGESEGKSNRLLMGSQSFGQVSNKPLLRIPLKESEEFIVPTRVKSNDIFELATIFNDKLQQLIASLGSFLMSKAHAQSSSNSPIKKIDAQSHTCDSKR